MAAPLDTTSTNCKPTTRKPNTRSLLDRVLTSKSDKIHAVKVSASVSINPPSALTEDLLVESGREDSKMQQNANWLSHDASNPHTPTLIHAPRLQRRTTDGGSSRAELGLALALEDAGHRRRQTEGYEQGKQSHYFHSGRVRALSARTGAIGSVIGVECNQGTIACANRGDYPDSPIKSETRRKGF